MAISFYVVTSAITFSLIHRRFWLHFRVRTAEVLGFTFMRNRMDLMAAYK